MENIELIHNAPFGAQYLINIPDVNLNNISLLLQQPRVGNHIGSLNIDFQNHGGKVVNKKH